MDEVKLSLAREAVADRGAGNVEFRPPDVADWVIGVRSSSKSSRGDNQVQVVPLGRGT